MTFCACSIKISIIGILPICRVMPCFIILDFNEENEVEQTWTQTVTAQIPVADREVARTIT